jgi:hypothetical protein
VDGTEIRVDVGECRELCNNLNQKKNLKREEFDKYLKKYPNLDPLQVCNYANSVIILIVPFWGERKKEIRVSGQINTITLTFIGLRQIETE